MGRRGFKVYTNSSSDYQVVWLDDNTAVLAPVVAPSLGYLAQSLGVRSECQSITNQCARCRSYQSDVDSGCDGYNFGPYLNCTGRVAYQVGSGAPTTERDFNRGTRLSVADGSPAFGDADQK